MSNIFTFYEKKDRLYKKNKIKHFYKNEKSNKKGYLSNINNLKINNFHLNFEGKDDLNYYKKNQKLNTLLNEYINKNNQLRKELYEEKNRNENLSKEINHLHTLLDDLNKKVKLNENYKFGKNSFDSNQEKKNIKKYQFELNDDEELISFTIMSKDESIIKNIFCKNTEIFSNIEKKLYEIYPEYFSSKYCFINKGKEINNKFSLKDNKIYNNDIIVLNNFNK